MWGDGFYLDGVVLKIFTFLDSFKAIFCNVRGTIIYFKTACLNFIETIVYDQF